MVALESALEWAPASAAHGRATGNAGLLWLSRTRVVSRSAIIHQAVVLSSRLLASPHTPDEQSGDSEDDSPANTDDDADNGITGLG